MNQKIVTSLVFLDLETDSKDPKVAKILEVAYAAFSMRGRLLRAENQVIHQLDPNKEVFPLIDLNQEEVDDGANIKTIFQTVSNALKVGMHRDGLVLVGHNCLHYDLAILDRLNCSKMWSGLTIVDTMFDLPFPPRTTSRRLVHLCADHGIPTPRAHGALYDCLYTAELFFKYDVNEVVARARTPLVWVKADVTYDSRELAKAAGFKWDGKQKLWVKRLRQFDREKFLQGIDGKFMVIKLPEDYQYPED